MPIRTIIAEDDEYMRKDLIRELLSIDDIEIEYSTDNGEDLMKVLKKVKPELIITDVNMPGISGVEAIKRIRQEIPDSEIIFITSYGEYIKDAVKLYASDFIEKPLDKNRLHQTIDRIKKKFVQKDRITEFKTHDSVEIVKLNDILFVEASLKKTVVHTSNKTFYSDYSLKETEPLLSENFFFKTHRSYIVNIQKIESLRPASRSSYEIWFNNYKTPAYLTKNIYDEFRKALKEFYKSRGGGDLDA